MKYIIWDFDEHGAGSETSSGLAITDSKFYESIYVFIEKTNEIGFFSQFKSNPRVDFEEKYYSEVYVNGLTTTLEQECGITLTNKENIYINTGHDPLFEDVFFDYNQKYYRYIWCSHA